MFSNGSTAMAGSGAKSVGSFRLTGGGLAATGAASAGFTR